MEKEKEMNINEIIDERIHKVAYRNCINDPDYKTANKKITTLSKKLRQALTSSEQRNLLTEIEDIQVIVEAIFLEYSYRQGVEDSRMFIKELV